MTAEPTRERVEAYEAALGCQRARISTRYPGRCAWHREEWTDLGCPVAVAAARVEAERVAEYRESASEEIFRLRTIREELKAERDALRAVVEQVRAHAEERCPDPVSAWYLMDILPTLPEATS